MTSGSKKRGFLAFGDPRPTIVNVTTVKNQLESTFKAQSRVGTSQGFDPSDLKGAFQLPNARDSKTIAAQKQKQHRLKPLLKDEI